MAGVFANNKLSPSAAKLDRQSRGAVARAIAASRFKGGAEDTLVIIAPAGIKASRIILVGLGKEGEMDALAPQSLGGRLYAALGGAGENAAAVLVDDDSAAKLPAAELAANIAYRRAAALLPVRQIPHQGKAGAEADR